MDLVALTPPGGPELLVILLIFVLLFGARKLPDLGSSIGKSIKNFKKGVAEVDEDEPATPGHDAEAGTSDGAAPASRENN